MNFRITSSVKSISLKGSSTSSLTHTKIKTQDAASKAPVLIEPDVKDQIFINLTYELNPLNSASNKRFYLKSKSLKIFYHATTINNIVYFFRSSESMQQKK
jgi:hypothetical protein